MLPDAGTPCYNVTSRPEILDTRILTGAMYWYNTSTLYDVKSPQIDCLPHHAEQDNTGTKQQIIVS